MPLLRRHRTHPATPAGSPVAAPRDLDFSNVPVGAVVQDGDGAILWCNPAAEIILGLTLDQMAGRTSIDPRWQSIREDGTPFPGDEHPAMVALRTGVGVDSVIMGVLNPAESRTRWIQVSAAPIMRPGEASAFRVVSTFVDVSSRKQVEDDLRHREARLNRAEVVARFGHWELDLGERTIRGSAGAQQLYGLAGDAWDLAKVQAIPLPEHRAALDEALKGLVEQGRPYDLEFSIRRADNGEIRHVHSVAEFDRARGVVFGVVHDITERKLAEEALTRQTAFVRAVFDADDAHMAVIGPDGTILEVNAAWREFARANSGGLATCDVGANYFRKCVAGGDLDAAEKAYEGIRRVQSGAQPVFEAVYPCHSPEEERWFVLRAMPVEGRAGTVLVAHRNETDRIRAEAALRESEARFEKAFRCCPVLMTLTELESGRYLDVNDGFCAVSGFSREEAVGRTPVELGWISAGDRADLVEALKASGRITNLELHLRSRDGRLVHCMYSGEVLDFAGTRCLLAVAADVSDLKRAEAQRQLLEGQVQHLHRMDSIGRLAGGVAHDMNNVLAAILGFAELEKVEAEPGSPLFSHMDTIAKACLRGRTVLRGLLDFAREGLAAEKTVDLNQLVREEVALLERTTLQRVRLLADLEPELMPVQGDPVALNHVLMNLCLNAVDAMPAGGELVLRTRNEGRESVLLEVVDNGAGMAPEVLDKALEPFFTTKAQGKGTGLGLAIAYRTVTAHRGTMSIRSAPGQGTTVAIRLPAGAGVVGEAVEGETSPASASRCLRVLLIDDDELIRRSTRRLIEALGHVPVVAESGEAALALLQSGEPVDVVILDVNMPGLGGAGTLPRLRELRPEVPVLLATGRVDQVAVGLVESNARVTLMPKPYQLRDLRAHLSTLA